MRFICNFNGLKSVRMKKQRNLLFFERKQKLKYLCYKLSNFYKLQKKSSIQIAWAFEHSLIFYNCNILQPRVIYDPIQPTNVRPS